MKNLEKDWDRRAKEIRWDDEYRKNILNSGDILVNFLSKYKKASPKKKILSGLLKIFDEPFYLIGLGGAHFYFFAKKSEK